MAGRREVRRHLRMASGIMATAVIRDYSNEFEIRNALSRSYYALFHVCHAWLAMQNVPSNRRKQHETLIREIRVRKGKESGDRLDGFRVLRKRADYDEPEFFEATPFGGDLDKFRLSAMRDQDRMTAEFDSYVSELESLSGSR